MLQIAPYSPTTQDLFLYEDHTILGSVVKRPYAWNPNCILYGYRRSLEGLVATYRNFSTKYPLGGAGDPDPLPDTTAGRVQEVNPWQDPVNRPIWWNSFPPTSRMISSRHLILCGHCFDISSVDRSAHLSQTLADLYQQGSYLDLMLNLRFIDGDNNIVELPKAQFEYPYAYDSAGGFPPNVPLPSPTVSTPYRADQVISVSSTPFPFNPVTLIDSGSVPISETPATWYYINAGNMMVQTATVARTGGAFWTNNAVVSSRGFWGQTLNVDDEPYLHDSGSVWMYPLSAPSSPAAGDGVMGVVAGHQQYFMPAFSEAAQFYWDNPPPRAPDGWVALPFFQPSMVNRRDAQWTAFQNYWTNTRGYPYPALRDVPMPSGLAKATAAQIASLGASVAAVRSHVI